MSNLKPQTAEFKNVLLLIFAVCMWRSEVAVASTAELYNPAWADELSWVGGNTHSGSLYHAPTGSWAYVEDMHTPWWQQRVAHPVDNYDSALLPVGTVRLDGALDVEYT